MLKTAFWVCAVLVFLSAAAELHGQGAEAAAAKTLFDFGDEAQVKAWTMWQRPEPAKGRAPKPEPEATLSHENGALKITYAGGLVPTIVTKQVIEDFSPYQTIKVDLTLPRRMVLGLRIMQEKSMHGSGYRASTSRWESTAYVDGGKQTLSLLLKKGQRFRTRPYDPKKGKALTLAFIAYRPLAGEVITIDNIRVESAVDAKADNAKSPNDTAGAKFKVLGTKLEVANVNELMKKLGAKACAPPPEKTIEEVEAAFKAQYEKIKTAHPKAVLAVLRDGQKGYDPNDPEKVFAGWGAAYINSHGPDGNLYGRGVTRSDGGSLELFMRHRSQMMRVELSSIPKDATVHAALLVLQTGKGTFRSKDRSNMFVAEPCNRPWVESEVNAYRWAAGKLWTRLAARGYQGEDPDMWPVFIAHGPVGGKVITWDFTHAVNWWVNEGHANHGFFLYGNSGFIARTYTRRLKDVAKRPGLMVIYEP